MRNRRQSGSAFLFQLGIDECMSAIEKCSQIVQSWGYYRDQGRWDELLQTFHADGRIKVTWFDGLFTDFVDASRISFKPRAPRPKHVMAPSHIEVHGNRAVAQTSSAIWGTTEIEDVICEGMTQARFLDRLECREGDWRIIDRTAIYERDLLIPQRWTDAIDAYMRSEALEQYPAPYRFLADRLVRRGQEIAADIPCDGDPLSHTLLKKARNWMVEA